MHNNALFLSFSCEYSLNITYCCVLYVLCVCAESCPVLSFFLRLFHFRNQSMIFFLVASSSSSFSIDGSSSCPSFNPPSHHLHLLRLHLSFSLILLNSCAFYFLRRIRLSLSASLCGPGRNTHFLHHSILVLVSITAVFTLSHLASLISLPFFLLLYDLSVSSSFTCALGCWHLLCLTPTCHHFCPQS